MTACPVPSSTSDTILLGHGGGGRMTADLLKSVFLQAFGDPALGVLEDQAKVPVPSGILAIATDAFVVHPLFFPGGDIGRLAVSGTVNDLVVGGARPLYLTAAFVLEEGLPISDLRRIVTSMKQAADEAEVRIVAGDTKVVDRGKGDGVYIATTGVGAVAPERADLGARNAKDGDAILVSGTIGDHGMAIMTLREGLELETALASDVAPLGGLVEALLGSGVAVRAMRDPTRGGLAATIHEIADASGNGAELEEEAIPLRAEVRAACEILGLDPLHVANEGKLVAIVAAADAERALAALHGHPLGRNAAIIGRIVGDHPRLIRLRTEAGGDRLVARLSGEQLPRIC